MKKVVRVSLLLTIMVFALSVTVLLASEGNDAQAELNAAQSGINDSAGSIISTGGIESNITCPAGTIEMTTHITDALVTATASADGAWEYGTPLLDGAVGPASEFCDGQAPTVGPSAPPNGGDVWATNLDGCYPNSGVDDADLILDFNFPTTCDMGTPPPIEVAFSYWYQAFTDFDEIYFTVDGVRQYTDDSGGPGDIVGWNSLVYNVMPDGQLLFEFEPSTVVNYSGIYLEFGDATGLPAITYCACDDATAVELSSAESTTQTSFASMTLILSLLGIILLTAISLHRRES